MAAGITRLADEDNIYIVRADGFALVIIDPLTARSLFQSIRNRRWDSKHLSLWDECAVRVVLVEQIFRSF